MSHSPATPSPLSDADWAALMDYLCQEGTEESRAALEHRLATDAAFAAAAKPVIALWRLPLPPSDWDVDAGWAALEREAARLRAEDDTPTALPPATSASSLGDIPMLSPPSQRGDSSGPSPRRAPAGPMPSPASRATGRWRWHLVLLAAASLLAVVGLSTVRAHLSPRYRYAGGSTGATVRLPDGSVVTLAPGSYLGTDRGFPSKTRTLHLFGAARFTVAPDARVPFIIQVIGARTRVLGTTFRVRADTLPALHVGVEHGSVSLATLDSSGRWRQVDVLTAGQAVDLTVLSTWLIRAADELAAAGVPAGDALRIGAALRRAAIRLGADEAARRAGGGSAPH